MTLRPFWPKKLHNQVFLAMLVGAALGVFFGDGAVRWTGFLGTIFVRLLRMVIVPLIFTSIISGVVSAGGGAKLGRLSVKTLVYYISTSLIAVLTGLFLVNLIRPGVGAELGEAASRALPTLQTPESLGEIFYRMIPTNPVAAMANGDMLALIFFSIVCGAGILALKTREREALGHLVDASFELMMTITAGIVRLAPLGVLGLIAKAVAQSGVGVLSSLGLYMITIMAGLIIHLFLTLPLLLKFVGRVSPQIHYRNMSEAMLMAFSTSSSSATLPVTLRCAEEKVGVSNRISSFVLPMGSTINMDGTALYECVGVIFIAQVMGIPLGLHAQIVVVVTALLASIGAAGIPSAGLVMIFIITDAIHLQGPQVGLIVGAMLAVDRPLDMFRTMVNVTSDSCGAAIIAKSEGEEEVDAGIR